MPNGTPLDWLRVLQQPCDGCPHHESLTHADMAVASALIRWANVTTCTTRSTVEQLADTARCDRKTVMRSISKLRAHGWLLVRSSTRGKYGRGVNLYVLTRPETVDNCVPQQKGKSLTGTYLSPSQGPTYAEVSPTEGHAVGTRDIEGGTNGQDACGEHMASLIEQLGNRLAIPM